MRGDRWPDAEGGCKADAASNPQYGGYRFFAFRHVEDIRAIMEKYGDTAKKIVLLEFGWTFDPVNPAYKWAGGGMLSTATDLVRFGAAEFRRRPNSSNRLHVPNEATRSHTR